MYALPRPSSYIAKSKIVFPRPRTCTCSANNNMSTFSVPVFSAGDFSVSSGVQEHIAPRRIDRFLPRCFRRGCFLPRMELSPANRPGQSAKGRARNLGGCQIRAHPHCLRFWNFALTGVPRRARAGRNCNGHRGDGPNRAPSSTETFPSCVVKNSYPLTVPKCSEKLNSDADFSSPKNT